VRTHRTPIPNRLIVRLADDMLGRRGCMVRAVEAIGRGTLAAEGVPVLLPASASRDMSAVLDPLVVSIGLSAAIVSARTSNRACWL